MSKTTGKKLSLAAKTFIGFVLGIVIGLIFKEKASIIKPVGTICYYIFAPWFMAASHRHGTSRCLNC